MNGIHKSSNRHMTSFPEIFGRTAGRAKHREEKIENARHDITNRGAHLMPFENRNEINAIAGNEHQLIILHSDLLSISSVARSFVPLSSFLLMQLQLGPR